MAAARRSYAGVFAASIVLAVDRVLSQAEYCVIGELK